MNRQTYLAKNDEVAREWIHLDATDQVFGRLASQIAMILTGKTKPTYTPHHDVGDFVVVTNASQLRFTGAKLDQKFYQTFSGHPDGLRQVSYRDMLAKDPGKLLSRAVQRMMPKNRLARQQLTKLKVYAGDEHPHQPQQPRTHELSTREG